MPSRSLFRSVASGLLCALLIGQAQAQPAPPSEPQANTAQAYRLGSGDQLRIQVYQSPDLSIETRLNDMGSINYPLLGLVNLAGMTIPQAEAHLADALRNGGLVRNPQVMMLVMQNRASQISVLGMVGRPGRYPLDVANVRLTEVLAMMGGIPDSGSDTIVIVGMRGSKRERITVDLPSLFSPQGQDKDPLILPGDVIWVDRAAMVYLQGEIGRPGALRWDRNQTLQQVIALAGGISPRGTLRGLKIHRRAANGQVETIEDPSLHEPPQAGDVIIIPESLF